MPLRFQLIVVSLILGVFRPVDADSVFDHLMPRLERGDYPELVGPLGLGTEQALIANMALMDYNSDIIDLAEETIAAADEAGRKRLMDVLAGRAVLSPEEIRTIRVNVFHVYQRAWPRTDTLLQGLFDSIEGILTDEQRPQLDAAIVDLRRRLWLRWRREGRETPEYAGEGVDVFDLVDAAGEPGGELERLDRDAIAATLDAYAKQIDTVLMTDGPAERNGVVELRIARIELDVTRRRALEREALARWRRSYQLSERTVGEIGRAAAAALGEDVQKRWQMRWRREAFPWLYRDTRPDRLRAWMRSQSLGAEQRRQASVVYDEYRTGHADLVDRTIAVVLRGRLEKGWLVTPASTAADLDGPGGRELHEQLLKLSGERQELVDKTSTRLEGILTPDQWRKLRDEGLED